METPQWSVMQYSLGSEFWYASNIAISLCVERMPCLEHGAVTRRLYASAVYLHRVFAPQVCTGNIQGKLTRGKCLAELKTNVRPDISHKVHLAKFTTLV